MKITLFKNNITNDVQAAALMIQKVQVVETEAQKIELEGYLKHAKKIRTQVETLRKAETVKLDDAKKRIMAAEKDFASDLDAWMNSGIMLINAFNKQAIEAARAQEALIKAEAEAAAKRLRSPISLAAVEIKAQAQLQEIPTVSGIRRTWCYQVTEPRLVPIEFLIVDEKKIAEFVKNGGREIQGVRIYEDFGRSGR